MRVLYFLAHPYGVGGAAKQMLTHARIVKSMGHKVKVILQNDESGCHDKEYERICSSFDIDYGSEIYDSCTCIEEIDALRTLEDSYKTDKIVEEFRPDLIHNMQMIIAVKLSADRFKVPCVMSIYQISQGMFNIRWEDIFPRFHCGDSEFFCRQWANGLGIRTECIRVTYQGRLAVEGRKAPSVSHEGRYEIISIAHFAWQKNQLEIIKFIEQCVARKIDVHASFWGAKDKEYYPKCSRYVEEHNLAEQVSFEGYIENVEECLSKADLLVHASRMESYPGVIVEAMANRIPVMVTPVAGVTELVADKVNGFIISGYSYEDIYAKFIDYLEFCKTGRIETIVSNAMDTFTTNHTYDVAGYKLTAYYKDICSSENIKEDTSLHNEDVINRLQSFYEHNNLKEYSKYTQSHCWYIFHLGRICDRNSSALIWGTGEFGDIGLEWCNILGVEVRGYIDSYKTGSFMEYEILKPSQQIIDSVDFVFVSVAKFDIVEEIMAELNRYGRVRNIDYFLIHNDPCLVPKC